jgi:two-component system, LytTR family, response regulator
VGSALVESDVESSARPTKATSRTGRFRTLVIDSDLSARTRVVTLLRSEPDIEVVGECATGSHARAAIQGSRPDLLFLEANMPDLNSLEFARSLSHQGAAVVFVTARHDYAVHAFDIRAVDYVLKPFSDGRFTSAVSRARLHLIRTQRHPLHDDVRHDRTPSSRQGPARRLVVKSNGQVHLLPTHDIDWCEAVGNYVRFHVGLQTYFSRGTLTRVEARLDSTQFVRVHRSAVVNIERIQALVPSANGEWAIRLCDQTQLTLSRGYRGNFEAALGESL